jgi:sec-independent protein translocase protein TatA
MFGLGTTELLILAGIVVLLFGAAKLPQLGAGLGQGIRNFKKSVKEPDSIDVTPKDEDKKEKKNSDSEKTLS